MVAEQFNHCLCWDHADFHVVHLDDDLWVVDVTGREIVAVESVSPLCADDITLTVLPSSSATVNGVCVLDVRILRINDEIT